jgi:protein DGCR14
MASPSQQAVVKRQADVDMALMPPPPPAKKIKRPSTVLDEDSYTDALSHIIARDFFPGLLEIQTKQEFLDAYDSKDKEWIARAGKRLSEVMTPGGSSARRGTTTPHRNVMDTPTTTRWGNETPVSVASTPATPRSSISGVSSKDRIDVSNLSLNSFQAEYTSEDNESFNSLLDKQNAKRREKYAWKWSGNKILSARQIAHRQREAKRIEGQGSSSDSKELVLSTDLDARPAVPDTWKSAVENSFMFTPGSVEEQHETRQQKAEAASRAGPKQVVYGNTRINGSTTARNDESSIPPSPSLSAIKDAIAGRVRHMDESSVGGEYTGSETPRVNGYAFVDEDEPEEDDEAVYERLRLLASERSSGDATPNPFNIRENRKREDLHHRMVDRVARKKRAEKAGIATGSNDVPRFPSSPNPMFSSSSSRLRTPIGSKTPRGKPLTPAAQKLLAKVGSTPRQSSSSSRLRNMWTPTPKRK